MSRDDDEEEKDDGGKETKSENKQVHKSINAVWYFVILVLFLALVALIIAIVAMFYPKNTVQSVFNKVVSVNLSSFSGDKSAFAGAAVTLPLNQVQGTHYLINSSTTTLNPILPPIIINGQNIQGNSNFSISSTNTNKIYLIFTNFNNMQNSVPVILNANNNYISCYVDINFNLYYQLNISYPYYNGKHLEYNSKNNAFKISNYATNNSPISPTVLYMISIPTGGISTNTAYKDSFLNFVGNTTPSTSGYVYFNTDSITTTTSGYNILINNTVNTIYYTYGTTAAYNKIIGSTSPTPQSYYIYSLAPNATANIVYSNGVLIYPVLPTTTSTTSGSVISTG